VEASGGGGGVTVGKKVRAIPQKQIRRTRRGQAPKRNPTCSLVLLQVAGGKGRSLESNKLHTVQWKEGVRMAGPRKTLRSLAMEHKKRTRPHHTNIDARQKGSIRGKEESVTKKCKGNTPTKTRVGYQVGAPQNQKKK